MFGLAALLFAAQYAPAPPRADAARLHLPPRHVATAGRTARASRLKALDQAVQGLDPNLRPARYEIDGPAGL